MEYAVVVALVGMLVCTGIIGVRTVQEHRNRRQIEESLRNIGLAVYDYRDTNGRFPSPAVPWGWPVRPWSWRAGLLPYLGEWYSADLKLDQPWDSPQNRAAFVPITPTILVPVGRGALPRGYTCYRMFAGKEAAFDKPGGVRREDLADPAHTILVVEAREPVFWTQPEGLPYDPAGPLPSLGGTFKEGFYALMADGSVRFIRHDTDERLIRSYITGKPFVPAGRGP